jgi:hypothetical protein
MAIPPILVADLFSDVNRHAARRFVTAALLAFRQLEQSHNDLFNVSLTI